MHAVRVVVATLVVLAVAATAQAGPRGQWTRLPGTVVNFAEPGLARTRDGVLHLVYVRKNGTKADLAHAEASAAGKVGAASIALGGWSSMSHPDLLRMPDGSLRAFFGGIRSTASGESNNSMNTATAPAAGTPWTLNVGKAAQSASAYSTTVTGAGLAKDGTPISAWSGTFGVGFHYGINPADPDVVIKATTCCFYNPEIAVDSSGQAYVGYYSNQPKSAGLFVQGIVPRGLLGLRKRAPGSVTKGQSIAQDGRTVLTARIGAPGVYLVYGRGYPIFTTIAVWQVTSKGPQIVLGANRAEHVSAAAAPNGRLWLMWEQSGTIFAARTNRSATRVGAVNTLRAPGSRSVHRLNGEGSAGPLDLVVNDGQGFWHQQVWPKLQLVASSKKAGAGRAITFLVLDAGDPVAGATVRAGGKSLETAADGRVILRQAQSARVRATASRAGYAPASTTVR